MFYIRPSVSKNYDQYKADYIKLYIDTIMPIVIKEDPSRPFLPSSPSNGPKTVKEDWISTDPQDLHFGDGELKNPSCNDISILLIVI